MKKEKGLFIQDGLEREYYFVPGQLNALVVILHGYRVAHRRMLLRYQQLEEKGFPLLLPQGVNESWSTGVCCGDAHRLKLNDTVFVRRVTEYILTTKFNNNLTKVYLTGTSNGAFLSSKIALEAIEQNWSYIKAVALIAGYSYDLELYGRAWKIQKPQFPIIAFHGQKDIDVPIDGRTNCTFIDNCVSFRNSRDEFMKINQCKRETVVQTPLFMEFRKKSNCFSGINCKYPVTFCEFPDLGHSMKHIGNIVANYFEMDLNGTFLENWNAPATKDAQFEVKSLEKNNQVETEALGKEYEKQALENDIEIQRSINGDETDIGIGADIRKEALEPTNYKKQTSIEEDDAQFTVSSSVRVPSKKNVLSGFNNVQSLDDESWITNVTMAICLALLLFIFRLRKWDQAKRKLIDTVNHE